MSSVSISPPNGILFLLDPTNRDVVVPPYVDGELTASTESCISVGTQAPIDGETEVALSTSDAPLPGLNLAFSGSVLCPNGKIAVVTAEFQNVLEVDVPEGNIRVSIWVDDLEHPSKVVININGGRTRGRSNSGDGILKPPVA